MQTILLGITSGIAAFKAVELVERLKQRGFDVIVMMTAHAKEMMPEVEFARASGHPVASELFPPGFDYKTVLQRREVEHISLADRATVACVVPATANVLAKIAHGLADDLLTTTLLATNAPVLFCPAMNVNMWNKAVTQQNVETLKQRGYWFTPPQKGMLACGYEGVGRLADIPIIEADIVTLAQKRRQFEGKRILVTAGGTEEAIDQVRVITNRSSGKMGVCIAEECVKRGAQVTLIHGRIEVTPTVPLRDIAAVSATAMFDAIAAQIGQHDIIIHAAAVSDFTVTRAHDGKISSAEALTLELTPNVKIISQIKRLNPRIFLVGFKAEHNISDAQLVDKALQMIQSTGADLVVANDVGRHQVFGADQNEVLLISPNGAVKQIERADKRLIAAQILDELTGILTQKPQETQP